MLELHWGKHRPFGRLPAIEIGAGELGILESSEGLGEFSPMVAPLEVDRLVEEDVIQRVVRGELEAV